MQSQLTLKRHADLVDRMAATVGLDLEEQMLEGRLDPIDLSEMVLRCTGCADPGACERWIEGTAGALHAMDGCRNAKVFDLIKAGKHV